MTKSDEFTEDDLSECCEQLDSIELDLFAFKKQGARFDAQAAARVFRAVHQVHEAATRFGLPLVRELAQQTEQVLDSLRSHEMIPTPDGIRVLLWATDRLRELLEHPAGDGAGSAEVMTALKEMRLANTDGRKRLRVLVAEDDFVSRLLLQTFLSRYGECSVAENGQEAVEACRGSFAQGQRYDLICMDIMMPEMDGREAVRQVRALEEAHGIFSTRGAKIIMTTAVGDISEVSRCFHELCDAYLTKPIDLARLLEQMKSFQLV